MSIFTFFSSYMGDNIEVESVYLENNWSFRTNFNYMEYKVENIIFNPQINSFKKVSKLLEMCKEKITHIIENNSISITIEVDILDDEKIIIKLDKVILSYEELEKKYISLSNEISEKEDYRERYVEKITEVNEKSHIIDVLMKQCLLVIPLQKDENITINLIVEGLQRGGYNNSEYYIKTDSNIPIDIFLKNNFRNEIYNYKLCKTLLTNSEKDGLSYWGVMIYILNEIQKLFDCELTRFGGQKLHSSFPTFSINYHEGRQRWQQNISITLKKSSKRVIFTRERQHNVFTFTINEGSHGHSGSYKQKYEIFYKYE